MNSTLNALLLASSMTINSANINQETTQLDKTTTDVISKTELSISTTLDPNLPQRDFQRQSELNVIYANGEYFFIEGNKESGYKMHTTNIKNIPDDAVCKNYSGEPVFYVGETQIKELGSWNEEKIGDEKFEEFQNMPSCDTSGAKNLASN